MSRVRILHPEFGYAGTPSFFRPITAFVVCGLMAGAMSFVIFDAQPDRDPRDAMALAPDAALLSPQLAEPATQSEQRPTNRPATQSAGEEAASAGRNPVKPACRDSADGQAGCARVRIIRMRPIRAVNDRPPIAAVPIGHRDDPTVLAASPQTQAGAGPLPTVPPQEPKATQTATEESGAETIPSDAAPAAEPAPAVSIPAVASKKPPPRVHHASRRNQYSDRSSYSARNSRYSASRAYVSFGYARLW